MENKLVLDGPNIRSVRRAAASAASVTTQAPSEAPAPRPKSRTPTPAPLPLLSTQGKQTAATIVEAWINHPNPVKMVFTEANLSPEELLKLYTWSKAKGVIFFSAAGTVTVKVPADPDEADFAWAPEDEM